MSCDMFLQKAKAKGHRETPRSNAVFIALIEVMASSVYAYVLDHQIMCMKYVYFLYINYTSIKLIKQ